MGREGGEDSYGCADDRVDYGDGIMMVTMVTVMVVVMVLTVMLVMVMVMVVMVVKWW